jgi:DNA-binding transcriptional regulator YhcF (GntR family)
MQSDHFSLTQEFLAMMLGVQRTGVTHAASNLQRAGLIKYTRGKVRIIDSVSLEQHSCECYDVTKRDFNRLLGILEIARKTNRLSRTAVAGASLKSE